MPGRFKLPVVGPQPATTVEEYASLRRWNAVCGVAHGVQGVVILVLGAVLARGPVPMSTGFSSFGPGGFIPGLQQRGVYNPGGEVCVIFFMSALVHAFLASQRIAARYATEATKYRASQSRWAGYAVSYGWMFFLVGLVIGMHDIFLALAFMGLVACQMFLQLSIDIVADGGMRRAPTDVRGWSAHFLASIPLIYVAVVLYSYQYNEVFRDAAPKLTQAVSMTAIFFPFALLLVQVAYVAGVLPTFAVYEKTAMGFDLLGKTVVGWLLFAFFVYLFDIASS